MIDVSSAYKISETDQVFIDTNILIFLFSPSFVNSSKFQVSKYSAIFEKLIEKKCSLYINQAVVSEFINRCLRLDFEHNFNTSKTMDYKKDYRPSPQYQATLRIVLRELKKVLKLTKPANDDFESFDVMAQYTANMQSDFNDLIIADTVKKKKFKLLSDDGDFKSAGIDTEWYLK